MPSILYNFPHWKHGFGRRSRINRLKFDKRIGPNDFKSLFSLFPFAMFVAIRTINGKGKSETTDKASLARDTG